MNYYRRPSFPFVTNNDRRILNDTQKTYNDTDFVDPMGLDMFYLYFLDKNNVPLVTEGEDILPPSNTIPIPLEARWMLVVGDGTTRKCLLPGVYLLSDLEVCSPSFITLRLKNDIRDRSFWIKVSYVIEEKEHELDRVFIDPLMKNTVFKFYTIPQGVEKLLFSNENCYLEKPIEEKICVFVSEILRDCTRK